jgi:hypothetical protein
MFVKYSFSERKNKPYQWVLQNQPCDWNVHVRSERPIRGMDTRPEDVLRLSALVDRLSDTSPTNTEIKPPKSFTSERQFFNFLPQQCQKIRFLSYFPPLLCTIFNHISYFSDGTSRSVGWQLRQIKQNIVSHNYCLLHSTFQYLNHDTGFSFFL